MRKSEISFLLKKIKEYEDVLRYHKKWSIREIWKYEEKWRRICSKYDQVCIYGIDFMGIGETIPRLFMFMHDKEKRNKNQFALILPTFSPGYYIGKIFNNRIYDIYRKQIHFITKKNLAFWKYVAVFHADRISMEYFDTYKYRDCATTFLIDIGKPLISFSSELEQYARSKMQQMGIEGDYICIHAREVATKTKNYIASYDDTSIIDADINSYGQACNYMQRLGYQSVRMGKDESRKCEIAGVIDYANEFYDELMDFYLMSKCKFMIGGMAGIVAVAPFWGRPALITNALSFCYGKESLPRTEYDLYIPKKFYSKREKRFLNLYESWDVSFKCDRYTDRFKREEIEIINNTEEEILNATVEMNQKLDQTWVQTEEEKRCREKYWRIIDLWKEKHKLTYVSRKMSGKGRDMFPYQICYSYLKENMYLLDVEGVI